MPEKFDNILKYNQGQKSMKIPFFIYADTESLLEKIQTGDSNIEKSFISKIKEYAVCGYLLLTLSWCLKGQRPP